MSTHTLNFPGADINTTQLTVGTGGLSVNSSVLRVDASASRVGIGILTPQHTLDVVGDINTTGGIFADSNVGIGTATARYTLDINGDLNFSGDLYQGGSPFAGSPWDVSGSDISYTTGNVGIGAANPGATLQVTGNAFVSSNLNVDANVFIAGGLVTNTGGVTKKTYSQTGTITTGTAPNIDIVFSDHAFSAKITAQLIESDIEISTLNIDVTGGRRGGASTSTLNIAKGPLSIFGDATSNPWSTTVGATTTTVTLTPSTNLDGEGHYNIFVEYISGDAAGSVSTIGGTSTGY
ncbi:hypothetical protein MpV1_076 [Micromonas sp. RCC1109 virus MpV1]|uniref:hypothetical protein n=1 Tax=Micromonas sp. RCC1109 virus MpV1 TaxID=880161 RepID=UPI0001EF4493|nr:hypothetical protein MpV1_076 [Micromonas sp. RCC1109 virus MpV1]ADQ90999.1 hypothetical protein MpV1_076 [Micromonas sp. RCC1109 virus MpV1]